MNAFNLFFRRTNLSIGCLCFGPSILEVESFGEVLEVANAGENVGVLLRKTAHDEITKGQVLAKAETLTPHREFEAEVYVLKKEEGGRHTPFFDGYAPQFFFRTTRGFDDR